jgi:hypothetical protein
LTGTGFESLVSLDKPSDDLFTLIDQVDRISFDLILTIVTLEKIKPADLEMESKEEDQIWVGAVVILGVEYTAVDLVEGRIVCGGGVESVCHVLDAGHHRVDVDGCRITGGKRGLA